MREIHSWKELFGTFRLKDLLSFRRFLRSPWWGWFSFFVWVALLAYILSFEGQGLPTNYQVGKVANKTLKADRNYEILDYTTTEANRREARQG
ncbi:MAG: hypothetical protein KDK66_08290, partial [Deltaproteobacteria bacterium]|nr:hypothetical protein [Deltaproteobacteria bacterium]